MNRTILATAMVAAFISTGAQAADPTVRCESDKLGELGRYSKCAFRVFSKTVANDLGYEDTSLRLAKCEKKIVSKWDRIEVKAGPGVCPTENVGEGFDADLPFLLNEVTRTVYDSQVYLSAPTTTTTTTTLPDARCCQDLFGTEDMCLWVSDTIAGYTDCEGNGFVLGAVGSVCDGATGDCILQPVVAGGCCELWPGLCVGGVDTASDCEGVHDAATFYPNSLCNTANECVAGE